MLITSSCIFVAPAFLTPSLPSTDAEHIAEKGREQVTCDDLVKAIRNEGRAMVPDAVKAELLAKIKSFIMNLS